jgi:hypothetical protein
MSKKVRMSHDVWIAKISACTVNKYTILKISMNAISSR